MAAGLATTAVVAGAAAAAAGAAAAVTAGAAAVTAAGAAAAAAGTAGKAGSAGIGRAAVRLGKPNYEVFLRRTPSELAAISATDINVLYILF